MYARVTDKDSAPYEFGEIVFIDIELDKDMMGQPQREERVIEAKLLYYDDPFYVYGENLWYERAVRKTTSLEKLEAILLGI